MFRSTNLEHATIEDISQKLSQKGGEIAMTTAEKLINQGKQEGRQEGKQEGKQ